MQQHRDLRPVLRVVPSQQTLEGAGFLVHRPFPNMHLDQVDPFLLLDQMGPVDLGPGEAKGAPDHPHRGFETVTYVLEGRVEHRDSQGNSGSIGPGDVQWMTAGAGVVHSEMPGADLTRNGGRWHAVQIWVNLPRQDKMMTPRYQEIGAHAIPVVEEDGATIRVIAGQHADAESVIDTRTPIGYLHVTVRPGGQTTVNLPAAHNAFVYLLAGSGTVSGQDVPEMHLALLGTGNHATLENRGQTSLEAIVLSGQPLREPVARWGPFVMNDPLELQQAQRDYWAGRMGNIPASVSRQ